MRKAIVGFLAFWVVAMAAAAPAGAAEPIVFGLVDEVTGPQAEGGRFTVNGLTLAKEGGGWWCGVVLPRRQEEAEGTWQGGRRARGAVGRRRP